MKILVAVITYNEELNIERTLEDLKKHNFGYDMIVIDNGSTDDTVQICRRMGVEVISHCINSGGQFGVVSTYFLYAFKNNYDVLCQFDGDGQHRASELKKIILPIENNEADYVIGSRFIEKKGFQSYYFRRIGIKLFSKIDSIIIRNKVSDVTSGFRAYSSKVINFFAKTYRHEIFDSNQLLLLSHFIGAKIKEVSVMMDERKFGKSEFNFVKSLSFTLKGLVNIAGCYLQRNQVKGINGGINGN